MTGSVAQSLITDPAPPVAPMISVNEAMLQRENEQLRAFLAIAEKESSDLRKATDVRNISLPSTAITALSSRRYVALFY